MSHRVDSQLLPRIRSYGAFDISECFNCGNCTAACSLADGTAGFPRRAIRYAQVGMEGRLLSDRGLWLCYACGECTRTCPRQAGPSEFMAAARRYAIARQDPTGLSRVMYGSVLGNLLVFALFSAVFTLLLLWKKGDMNGAGLALFDYIPGPWIHDLGVALFVVVGVAAVGGMARMFSPLHLRVAQGGPEAALAAFARRAVVRRQGVAGPVSLPAVRRGDGRRLGRR